MIKIVKDALIDMRSVPTGELLRFVDDVYRALTGGFSTGPEDRIVDVCIDDDHVIFYLESPYWDSVEISIPISVLDAENPIKEARRYHLTEQLKILKNHLAHLEKRVVAYALVVKNAEEALIEFESAEDAR